MQRNTNYDAVLTFKNQEENHSETSFTNNFTSCATNSPTLIGSSSLHCPATSSSPYSPRHQHAT